MLGPLSDLRLLGNGGGGKPRFAVLSGARRVFWLSPEVAGWLDPDRLASEPPESLARELRDEVERLARVGFWPTEASPQGSASPTVTLGLTLTTSCNLACSYCNVRDYGLGASLMSQEIADAALDVLATEVATRPDSTALLVFFGGEPTLNFEVLRGAARGFRSRFPTRPHDVWVVTNGTLIDAERAQTLADLDVLSVVSLDGPQEAHDKNRRFAATGAGSYSATMRSIEHLRKASARFTVRATWVPGDGDRLDRIAFLRREAAGAMQVTVAIDFHARAAGYAAYLETATREWDLFEEAGYRGHGPATAAVLVDLVLRANAAPEFSCPAGRDGFMVMPSGDIYPCQVLAAQQRLPLGNVRAGGLSSDSARAACTALHLDDPGPACQRCSIQGLCAGPCPLIRPLQEPAPSCAVLVMEIERACRLAASLPVTDLTSRYDFGAHTAELTATMARGAALRQILWNLNRHLRPLALYPVPLSRGRPVAACHVEVAC